VPAKEFRRLIKIRQKYEHKFGGMFFTHNVRLAKNKTVTAAHLLVNVPPSSSTRTTQDRGNARMLFCNYTISDKYIQIFLII